MFGSFTSKPAGHLVHIPRTGNVRVSQSSLNNYDNKLKNVMAKDTNSKGIWGVVQGEPQFDSWHFTAQNNN